MGAHNDAADHGLAVARAIAGHGKRLFADDDELDRVDSDRGPKGTLFLH